MLVIYTAPPKGIWILGKKYTQGQYVPLEIVRKLRQEEVGKLVPHKIRK